MLSFLWILVNMKSVIRSYHLWWKSWYYKRFCDWMPRFFISDFLKLTTNLRHSLLRDFFGNCLMLLKNYGISEDRIRLSILCRALTFRKRSPYLGNGGKVCLLENFYSWTWFSHLAHMDKYTAQKMKFSIKDFFSKCDKLQFLCSDTT